MVEASESALGTDEESNMEEVESVSGDFLDERREHFFRASDGKPSLRALHNAVQVWSSARDDEPVTVAMVAEAFRETPERVAACITQIEGWMFLRGSGPDALIEHDGE